MKNLQSKTKSLHMTVFVCLENQGVSTDRLAANSR